MAQILCTNVCKWKNETFETFPDMRVRGIKENDGGGKFKYNVFEIL
jgi:hypothetical protein